MSVSLNSRYNYSTLIRVIDTSGRALEIPHLDIRPRLVQTINPDLREYSPNKGDNWSRIAWRFLGMNRAWWVIADSSEVVDPFKDLKPTTRIHYLTQLSADLTAGAKTSATVVNAKALQKSMKLTIEDLNPSNPNSVDIAILTIDLDTNIITFPEVTVPAGGIVASLSRISQQVVSQVSLQIPTASRVLFDALDFSNPLNVLVE